MSGSGRFIGLSASAQSGTPGPPGPTGPPNGILNEISLNPMSSPSSDYGIGEAVKTLTALNGGTLRITQGIYAVSQAIIITGSNIRIVLDPGAVFTLPMAPGWSVTVNSSNVPMSPVFDLRSCNNLIIQGGQFYQTPQIAAASINQTGTGIHVGPNNTLVRITGGLYQNLSRWPIFINGYSNGVSGIWSYIYEDHNIMINCGGTELPDGGGVRLANDVSTAAVTYVNGLPTCPHHFYSAYSVIINTVTPASGGLNNNAFAFGWDCSNSNTGPLQYLYFDHDYYYCNNASGSNQANAFNLEDCNANNGSNQGALFGHQHVYYNHCTTIGSYIGFACNGNNFDINYISPIASQCFSTPMRLGRITGSTVTYAQHIRVISPKFFNNANGAQIGPLAAGNVTDDVIIDDWLAYNDAGSGSLSQAYGLILSAFENGTLSNVYIGKGNGAGCSTGAVLINAKGSGATYTNVALDSRIVGSIINNGGSGSSSNVTEETYPG